MLDPRRAGSGARGVCETLTRLREVNEAQGARGVNHVIQTVQISHYNIMRMKRAHPGIKYEL